LKDAPGGGRCVTFKDPVDGFPFHLIFGQEGRVDERKEPDFDDKELPNGNPMKLRFNYPEDKQRPVGQFQRFKKAPAPVYKLGHFGLCITDFAKAFEFYTTRFNFYPSEAKTSTPSAVSTADPNSSTTTASFSSKAPNSTSTTLPSKLTILIPKS